MAMAFTVELDGIDDSARAQRVVADFHEDLEWANAVFSLWDDHSAVSRLSRGEVTLDDCPREVREVLETCEWFRGVTGGGFDARRPDGVVDPTGVVKSWAVARAARRTLRAAGATDWVVGASGDVMCAPGGRPRRLGIADPRVSGDLTHAEVVDVIDLGGTRTALATSGASQDEHRIWDPATGRTARHFMQVSVVGSDVVACDAWATGIMAGGADVMRRAVAQGLEVLAITGVRDDGTLSAHASTGWPTVA